MWLHLVFKHADSSQYNQYNHTHTDLIGSQRDTPPAAGAEAALAVAAGAAAAVGELGFATDAAGGMLRPRRLSHLRLLPQLLHLVLIQLKLLMQLPAERTELLIGRAGIM